ncbi:hypothetical protein Hamer_G026714 [Homarus americanus]|uniref:Uncharacterized protein n=1 Tax=Homarus americanus TaxID=6706 RepID=A0A8J5MS22_HOMAM|nr:hypothetical protein Hamer_G014014 [Homarus americanus]KAG7162265.1 hypothetical protein Hamer_G026714 [Homarus americanus]
MGSFMGHVLPGPFFCLFPVWWIYNIFRRFHLCRRTLTVGEGGSSTTYRNTCTFTCSCCPSLPRRFHQGGFRHHRYDGVCPPRQRPTHDYVLLLRPQRRRDILAHYRASHKTLTISPPASPSAWRVYCFSTTGHPMDVQIHTLLLYVISGHSVLEMYHKRSVLAALARTSISPLQGRGSPGGVHSLPPVGKHCRGEPRPDDARHSSSAGTTPSSSSSWRFCFLIHFREAFTHLRVPSASSTHLHPKPPAD